jgi:hypothetical protein
MAVAEDIYVERVRRIVLDRLAGYDAAVYLFGSRARGDAARASDVDVAIDPRQPLSPLLLGDLAEALEESTIPYRVDIVDLGAAEPSLRARVLKEGVRWRD